MSLPKGGIFDYTGNYDKPHKSHDQGKDADINKDNLDCLDDNDFFRSVDLLLPPVRVINGSPTAVLCESRGRKHVDFELQY